MGSSDSRNPQIPIHPADLTSCTYPRPRGRAHTHTSGRRAIRLARLPRACVRVREEAKKGQRGRGHGGDTVWGVVPLPSDSSLPPSLSPSLPPSLPLPPSPSLISLPFARSLAPSLPRSLSLSLTYSPWFAVVATFATCSHLPRPFRRLANTKLAEHIYADRLPWHDFTWLAVPDQWPNCQAVRAVVK